MAISRAAAVHRQDGYLFIIFLMAQPLTYTTTTTTTYHSLVCCRYAFLTAILASVSAKRITATFGLGSKSCFAQTALPVHTRVCAHSYHAGDLRYFSYFFSEMQMRASADAGFFFISILFLFLSTVTTWNKCA